MPDYPGLGRTIPDYPGLSRTGTGRNGLKTPRQIAPRSAATRGKPLKTRGLPKPLRMRAPLPDGPRAAISCPCRAPFPASANDAAPRAACKPDHGPRDNFRPAAGRGSARAWRGWGFRAGGAARTCAPGVPPEKISRDNFAAAAARRHRCRRAGEAGGRRLFPSPPSGGRSGGGSAPGCAGVPPASREARTGPRRRVGSEGKDAGLRPAMPAGRRRSQAIHGWAGSGRSPSGPPSPWVNPPPDLPPSRGEERRRGGPPPCSAIESGSQRDPDSFSLPGARSEDARRSYLEILRRLADIAVAGQERTRGRRRLSSPLQGGGREGVPPLGAPRPAGLARSANEDAGLRPARPAGRRRSRAVHG